MTDTREILRRCLIVGIFGLMTAACGGEAAGRPNRAWIDVPVDGLRFDLGQIVQIEGHVAGPAGTTQVQVLVDGLSLGSVDVAVTEGAVAAFTYNWTPPSTGEFLLQVAPTTADGQAGATDTTHVIVVEPVTPTPTVTSSPTASPSPTPPPGAEVEFWVDPPEIAAGGCARLNWRVRDASRVRLGSTDVSAEGHYDACLCNDNAFTLTVTNLDGTEQQRRVEIRVTGECVTPTTPPDVSPPAAPALAVPADGLSIACKASQNLVWLPVDDPSGVAEYRLQVQRHSGDNNWQDVAGSVFTGIDDKQRSISVECGWYYRWRVRAVDGAGNVGPWSGWWDFVITLS